MSCWHVGQSILLSEDFWNYKKELLYYKRKTAATKLCIDDLEEDCIKRLKLLYSTGIVQSLSASSRELVRESFRIARENEVLTAYDPNYTSCFMNSSDTKELMEEILIPLEKNQELKLKCFQK